MSSNKNEVFEYLIDQLRQQVNKKDVTSFNVSVQISDLDEVKQVIHNLQQHIAGKDDEIRALKDSLRQQVGNNPYKQQCEDLAHEVQIKELHKALVMATGDVEAYKLIRKGGFIPKGTGYVVGEHTPQASVNCRCTPAPVPPEQSGCRKEDVQECEHSWIIMPGLFLSEGNPNNVPGSELCAKCGKREWDDKEYKPKNDTHECDHDWVLDEKGDYFVCTKCGKQEAELNDCQHTNTVGLRKGFAPGFTKKCLDCGAKLR